MNRIETIGDCKKREDKSVAIYALTESDGRIRYIGKTEYYIHIRHKSHIRAALKGGNLPVNRWIRKKIKNNEPLIIRLIEYVGHNEDWCAREKYHIKCVRAASNDCLNLCDGGEGLSGHIPTKEHRNKISNALKTGAYCDCNYCGATFWRKKNQIARNENKFCSKKCYQKNQLGKTKAISKTFTECGVAAAAAIKKAQTHCKNGNL